MSRLVAVVLALAACHGSQSATPSGARSTSTSAQDPASPPLTTGPRSLATTALKVGSAAPAVALTEAGGAPWTLSDAEKKHARVMLVFYRGDW